MFDNGVPNVFALDANSDTWVQKLSESRAMVILHRDALNGKTQVKRVIPLE
jgi:hypothetical protein